MKIENRNSKFEGMAPVLAAKAIIDEGFPRGIFEAALHIHLERGYYVMSTPRYFVMARAVRRDAGEAALQDLLHPHHHPDSWYVWVAAGNLREAMAAMPHMLQWTGFRRRLKGDPSRSGAIHWHPTFFLRRRIYGLI